LPILAHGAISWSGINPNWRMAKIITALQQLEEKEQGRHGKHSYLKWGTITPTVLQAPVKGDAQINVIPEQCMTTLDIRTIPSQNHHKIIEEIEHIFYQLKREDEHFQADYEIKIGRASCRERV